MLLLTEQLVPGQSDGREDDPQTLCDGDVLYSGPGSGLGGEREDLTVTLPSHHVQSLTVAHRLVVSDGSREVRAPGPGVQLRLVDLCGGEHLSSDGVPANTVDLPLESRAGVELSGLAQRTEALPPPAGGVEGEENTKQVKSDGGHIRR